MKHNSSCREFEFVLNNKTDADILQKELATAIFREITSVDKVNITPQVNNQENAVNNRRAKGETN